MMDSSTSEYLSWLFRDNGMVELRHHHGQQWESFWFDDPDALMAEARARQNVGNLYTSLNRPLSGVTGPLSNDGVQRYTRILFDFDPVRQKNVPATAEEAAEAEARARDCAQLLTVLGWPPPALGLSGNGWHLQYRTALPDTDEVHSALGAIYAEFHRRFSDDLVHFDRSVRNPGRICTLYGTVKRKGPSTPERPHRRSWIAIPKDWRQVIPQQILSLGQRWKPETPVRAPESPTGGFSRGGKGDYSTLDVVAWFLSHRAYLREIGGGKHAVVCPWSDEHSVASPAKGGDAIVFEPDGGWAGFHCKHAHCEGRDIRAVMALWGDADAFCTHQYGQEAA
jgi:hypothetical protein